MGLDMYLTRKTYVKNWDHYPDDKKFSFSILQGKNPYTKIDTSKICYIEEEVGYWRKANSIHKWFVDNVQDGEDDCGTYYVNQDKLQKLLDVVNTVLDASELDDGIIINGETSHAGGPFIPNFETGKVILNTEVAENLLPTAEGFFFGNKDYNQWYIEDLQETKQIIESVLAMDNSDSQFYYNSSW